MQVLVRTKRLTPENNLTAACQCALLGLMIFAVPSWVERLRTAQDLLQAVQVLLAGSSGAIALCATCSLDADGHLVLAARGRPLSVAFYPRLGLVLWSSEQVAGMY